MGIAVLTMAAGVLVISAGYAAGRAGSASSVWVAAYWLGEAIVFAPLAWRLASRPALGQSEAAGLVLAVATATYLVKVCYSPAGFGFPDELEHWRTTATLLSTHHLFGVNYLLPVSAVYPGLEEVTGAIATITGLPIFEAGLVVVGLAHLLFTAALFVMFRLVGGSPRVAAIACAIYAANPHYQVFDAIYGYQTLALAFFALALIAAFVGASVSIAPSTRGERAGSDRLRWWALGVAFAAATVITHHVTSYLLTGSLLLIAVFSGGIQTNPPRPPFLRRLLAVTDSPGREAQGPPQPGDAKLAPLAAGHRSHWAAVAGAKQRRLAPPGAGHRSHWWAGCRWRQRVGVLACRWCQRVGVLACRWCHRHFAWRCGAMSVAALGLGCLGLIALWVGFVATGTGSYLAAPLRSFADGLSGILTAHPAGSGATTPSGPLADRLAGYAATGLISVGLPFGWWQIWRTQRRRTWTVALGIGSVAYYVLAVLRITTPDGAEIAGRGMTFVFIPVAYTLAIALNGPGRTLIRRISWRWRGALRWGRASGVPAILAAGGVAVVLLAGGIASGWPPYWERLPGHYVVDGFESGITQEGIEAADWTRTHLGPGNRIAADFSNYLLLGSYGDQNPVGILDTLYCDPVWTEADALLARKQNISYLLVDLRMSEQPSVTGGYFSEASPACPSPIPKHDLTKFDTTPGFDRIYDSGNIVIYALTGAQYAP